MWRTVCDSQIMLTWTSLLLVYYVFDPPNLISRKFCHDFLYLEFPMLIRYVFVLCFISRESCDKFLWFFSSFISFAVHSSVCLLYYPFFYLLYFFIASINYFLSLLSFSFIFYLYCCLYHSSLSLPPFITFTPLLCVCFLCFPSPCLLHVPHYLSFIGIISSVSHFYHSLSFLGLLLFLLPATISMVCFSPVSLAVFLISWGPCGFSPLIQTAWVFFIISVSYSYCLLSFSPVFLP